MQSERDEWTQERERNLAWAREILSACGNPTPEALLIGMREARMFWLPDRQELSYQVRRAQIWLAIAKLEAQHEAAKATESRLFEAAVEAQRKLDGEKSSKAIKTYVRSWETYRAAEANAENIWRKLNREYDRAFKLHDTIFAANGCNSAPASGQARTTNTQPRKANR